MINHPGVISVKIRIGNSLFLLGIVILSVILILLISFFPSNTARIVFGLPFILFFPGYTLTTVISPRKKGMTGVFRVALSIGLSFAVVILIGFVLNYLSSGIRIESILFSIFAFIMVMSAIGLFGLRKLAPAERLDIEFTIAFPRLGTGIDSVLYILLILAVLSALGAIIYDIAMPKAGQNFNEFYLLGSSGQMTDYVEDLHVGQTGNVIVGIVNDDHETVTYRVEVTIGGVKNNEIDGITLAQGTKWQNDVSFTPQVLGNNQKVEFSLYRGEETAPLFEPLYLWVNITP
jgi:uncharacterized membrane protein